MAKDRFLSRRIQEESHQLPLQAQPPFPRDIMVELSNVCNHKCIFCANPKMTRKVGRIDKDLLVGIMKDAYKLGSRDIGFYTTGDPLVHKDLSTFVGQAKEIGYDYTYISTNGALATEDRIRALVEAGIDSIKFSINAGDRETYRKIHGRDDWDVVIRNLKFVSGLRETLDRKLNLGITYVVVDQNQHLTESFYNEIIQYVDEIYFSYCTVHGGNMVENKDLLGSDIEMAQIEAPCHMLFRRAHITCEGYMTMCCIDYQNYLAVCDLREKSLEEAWNDPLFQDMRRRHVENKLEGTLCYNCIRSVTTEIKPLREDLATVVDFVKLNKDNHERQKQRLEGIRSEQGNGRYPRETVGTNGTSRSGLIQLESPEVVGVE